MKDIKQLQERFLRDPVPRRLGGLDATLGRISSSARKSTDLSIVWFEKAQDFSDLV
jgi:hypothetical protein